MATNTYRNPIIPGFNPDPSICYVPNVGYLVSTSTFEFFPGLPLYHSTDLINWRLIGHAINRRNQGVDMQTVESSGGLWAPTLRYYKGRVYMICSVFWRLRLSAAGPDIISSGFYVSTDNVLDDSRWSEAVYFEETGFDQDILFDDDGKVYQTVTRFDFTAPAGDHPVIKSWINEIDIATGRSLTEPVLAKASPLGVAEGCHILKKDGFYYFFTAEGGTQDGHRECVYRSKNPLGPFEAPPEGVNPVIYNGNHPDIQNTGHMDLIPNDEGKWVAVFLGVRPVFETVKDSMGVKGMPSHLGRETFMAPMEWVDGWPVVNNRKPIELTGQAEGLTLVPEQASWSDDFDSAALALGWYRVRVPLREFHSLTERPGYLAIRGGVPLTVEHSPSILLQKQPLFDLDWSTELEFEPTRLGQEAGTAVWLGASNHLALALRRLEGGLEMVFRKPGGEGKFEESTFSLDTKAGTPITLHIAARRHDYTFYFQIGEGERVKAGTVDTSTLPPLFTGVQIGLYAQGSDVMPCLNSAYFKYAKWDAVSV